MAMRCFCAQAQKQVDKSKIYLAISSFHPEYLIKPFHPKGVRISTSFKNKVMRYFSKMILPVLSDSCYDLNWPINSCFLIGECTFSTI